MNSGKEPDLVAIGYLSKAHGIRGELVLVPDPEFPEAAEGEVFLRPRHGGAALSYAVAGRRVHHDTLLVTLKGVETRNQAELLRAHTVLCRRELLPFPKGRIFLGDLTGLRVFAVNDTTGEGEEREIGRLVSAQAPAGQIIWSIETPDGKEVLFPAVDEFVLSIDLEAKTARIAPPPGLLELYLGSER